MLVLMNILEELYLRIINTKYTANKDKPKRTSELKTKYFERNVLQLLGKRIRA